MARRPGTEELIHCDSCGEDYSATYKRCPFCGEKYDTRATSRPSAQDDDDDGYVFDGQDLFDDEQEDTRVISPSKGGKRLSGTATATRRTPAKAHKPAAAINWPRLITFLCSLVIIVAALVIIFTVIFPQVHDDPPATSSTPVAGSQPPVVSDPPAGPSGEVSAPPSAPVTTPDPTLTRLYMKGKNDTDFTLKPGESHTLTPGFEPADWSGDVTFTSSDESIATVDAGGKVTNVSQNSSLRRVTITVAAGGQTVECTVYCRGVGSNPSAPPVTTPNPNQSQNPSGGLTIGAEGKIVGASGGLRVRSGPGTSYSILASLVNGNSVTILDDAGDGWYRISYAGADGRDATGFIMGKYISVP